MNRIARSSSKKFALFIDEYDSFVIEALQDQTNPDNYLTMNDFFGRFFTGLKANVDSIPFQFITGSSRLAIKGFWSGPNNIVDLSSNLRAATALGYTWEDIEQIYPIQLEWLQTLHGLTRVELQEQMTDWYDRHRWSSDSSDHVFNTWSIHQFMNSGEFKPYWASTGSSSRLLDSKLLLKSLVSSVMHNDVITIQPKSLTDSRLPQKRGESLSDEAQKALLVGAGILAIDPKYAQTSQSTPISLVIPNLDAKEAIRNIFEGAISIPQSFDLSIVQQFIDQNNIIGLINHMIETNALRETLSFFSPQSKTDEFHLSLSFSTLLFYIGADITYTPESPAPRVDQNIPMRGKLPQADHVFHFPSTKTTHIIEFKIFSPKLSPKSQIADALEQCLKYKLLVPAENEALFSTRIFKDDGALLFATHSRSLNDATLLIDDLRSDKLNWQEENTYPILL